MRTSFEMTIRIGDVRAKDDGIKKRTRCLIALLRLEVFNHVLEHAFEERPSRATARAIEYQNSPIPSPTIRSLRHLYTPPRWVELRLTFPSAQYPEQQTT